MAEYRTRENLGITVETERQIASQNGMRATVLAMLAPWPHILSNQWKPEESRATLLILKGSPSAEALIKAGREGLKQAIEEGRVPKGSKLVKNGETLGVSNINDGDLPRVTGEDFDEIFHDNWVVQTHSKMHIIKGNNRYTGEPNATTWVEKDGEMVLEKARLGDFIGGNLVTADISLKPFTAGKNGGVTCYLNSITRYADGEPFENELGRRPSVPPKVAPTRYGEEVAEANIEQERQEKEQEEDFELEPVDDDMWDDFIDSVEEETAF